MHLSNCFIIVLAAAFCLASEAFSPPSVAQTNARKTLTFQPARTISGSMSRATGFHTSIYRMSDDSETEQKPAPTSGTYYDDEVDPIPASKQGVSDSMKERLRREASAGLDSESKQSNVILYICGAVAVLVLLGGQGILY